MPQPYPWIPLMSAEALRGRSVLGWGGRVVRALKNPLYRSGYALVANTVGTTMVGVAYWAVAAHLYDRQTVGRSSALITSLVVLSSFAQLNLHNTLPRFLPSTGRRSGRLIVYSYGASAAVALVLGVAFVAILPRVSERWGFVDSSLPQAAVFVAAAVVWGIFALQDAVLLSLRRAALVPGENTVYGVAKLLLLVGFAASLPASGIFISWVVPLAAIVPVMNWLIFRRYLRQREAADEVATVLPSAVLRFALIDNVGAMLGQTYNLLPMLVLSTLGAAANSSFYVAWTIATGLGTVAGNFATSLLVEASAAPHRLSEATRGVLLRCLAVTLAGTALLSLAGYPILSIYGHGYAVHGWLVLALLAAATIPNSLLAVTFSLDRIGQRVGRAALTRLVVAVLSLGGSLLLIRHQGVVGIGLAWLGANLVVALIRLPTIIGALRQQGGPGGRSRPKRRRRAPARAAIRRPPQRGGGLHRRPAGRHRLAQRP